jgi:type I restriction enzyme S subunit
MAERLRLWPGDVVLARIGATTGKAYLIRDEVDGVFASYLIRLRVKNELAPDFLEFFTNSESYWRQIDSVKGGRLKQGVNIPLLESLEIPLPPLAEQRAIAEVLRTVQRAKEATEKVIAATRQLKASLMKHLFTYGPVPLDQADQVELKETETGPVPEHWSCVPLGEVLTLAYRYPSYYNIQYVEQGVPEIRGELLGPNGDIEANMSMLRFISRETSDRFPKTQLEPGDIVMSVRGTMGKIGLVPLWLAGANITANLIRLALQRGKVLPEFLKRTLLSRSFLRRLDELSPQTTIKTIQAPVLRSIPIPLPPLSEQREMAAQLAAVDAKLETEESRREALDALFKSLLHHLMTAKLRLPEFAGGRT